MSSEFCSWWAGTCAAGISSAWRWGWATQRHSWVWAVSKGHVVGAAGDLVWVVPGVGAYLPRDVAPSLCLFELPTLPGEPGAPLQLSVGLWCSGISIRSTSPPSLSYQNGKAFPGTTATAGGFVTERVDGRRSGQHGRSPAPSQASWGQVFSPPVWGGSSSQA